MQLSSIPSALNGIMRIDYPYTGPAPIPIPAAVWLFGAGLVGLLSVGLIGRRRIRPA